MKTIVKAKITTQNIHIKSVLQNVFKVQTAWDCEQQIDVLSNDGIGIAITLSWSLILYNHVLI